MSTTALEKLAIAVEDLQRQVASLSDRLARLEPAGEAPAAALQPAVAAVGQPAAAAEESEGIAPEILLAISAAVAAYLGERAHVRAVRLIGSTRWSQEGRVSIQASHRLSRG